MFGSENDGKLRFWGGQKYDDFFELNKIVEYQNAEKAFNEFI